IQFRKLLFRIFVSGTAPGIFGTKPPAVRNTWSYPKKVNGNRAQRTATSISASLCVFFLLRIYILRILGYTIW
ncbi:hypothetical protein SERLA73DRAFT_174480, partial [Serpula lacrymans var. lacrymans S7.3]